ncbi:MAG: thioesterase domain-containing protein [Bacteroidota bacterium]
MFFTLQPKGLDGKEDLHSSIEEMAEYYIHEMKKVQSSGPYYLLGTCFSNAVGLEMAKQLRKQGDEMALLLFVDSGPQYLLGAKERGGRKTITRFAEMLKKGNWSGIQKKFWNRFIRTKQKALSPFENEQEKSLRLTIQNLNKLYHHYTWTPYEGKITFIRSTEFANRKDKDIHIEQWSKLAKGGLDVHVVEGHHQSLFAEPEVAGLASKIQELLVLNK